jgi:hypothetical protein
MQVKRKKEKKIPTQWARIIMLRLYYLNNREGFYEWSASKGNFKSPYK